MPYSALLAVHLLAVTIFGAVVLLTGFALPGLSEAPPGPATGVELHRLRAMNLYVATPALVLVWTCGITMAVKGGWYVMGWLKLKIVLVLLLSAIHGRQLASLRRITREQASPVSFRPAAIAAAAIVLAFGLATAKPF